MKEFDFMDFDLLSGIDDILTLVEDSEDIDDDNTGDNDADVIEAEDEHSSSADNESSDDDEPQDSSMSVFFDNIRTACDSIAENTARSYTEPDEKTLVSNKASAIFIASFSAAFIAIAVGLYFFFTAFNYYTTGITVDEFIDRFNSLTVATSDSDIYSIIPSYTDVIIPEDAKLSGKNTIELLDGHVVIHATTRFGKIVDMMVVNVDYPGYNPETFFFDSIDDTYYLYYYVALGKTIAAFNDEITTVYDATYSAYQMHQYAYIYMFYGQEPKCSVNINGNDITYYLREACLTVAPSVRTITSAVWPEWLTPKESEPVSDNVTGNTENNSEVSGTDNQ